MQRLVLVLALFFVSMPIFAANKLTDINEGIEYEVLDTPQKVNSKKKVEVIEFFSYACPHCYNLEPHVEKWRKSKADDVEFIHIPAVFNKSWEALASIYYTAEVLGVEDKLHPAIFEAIHGKGKKINSFEELKNLFVANGVSAADFDATLNSFTVANKTRKAIQLTKQYQVQSVPVVIVQGKYRTNSTLAHGHANVFTVVDHISERVRKEK